jgi:chromosome segregation ATPase
VTFNFQVLTLDFVKRHWRILAVIIISAVGGWWGFGVWNRVHEIRLATKTGALQSEIQNLKSQIGQAEDRAVQAEGRAQQLGAELEKLAVGRRQLAANLEKAKAEAAAEQARIAALGAAEVAAEVARQVGAPGLDAALRRTLEIIADRDACREQSGLKDQQFANCRESLVDYAAIGEQQGLQIQDLKQALDLERRAFDKRDDLAKNQVSAAKGSWLGRTLGKAKWFVVGVGAGAIVGAVAAR